jgi:phosphoribosylformylglycinamidine synthase
MKFGVVVFPGSNCDRDMIHALQNDLGQEVITLWHKEKDLSMFSISDCIILPGGFSYGDYLRCGAIARFSPMMQSVTAFAGKGGKVFGVCNGFQILCESGLLPGVLLQNAQRQFTCRNIYLSPGDSAPGQVYKIPVAHGEGRYFVGEKALGEIEKNNQVLYSYCNEAGDIHTDHSPNGSLNSIAAITNIERNVIGMMPHPERACSPDLGNTDGRKIFKELFSVN